MTKNPKSESVMAQFEERERRKQEREDMISMETQHTKFTYIGECEKCHTEFNLRVPFKQATQNFIFGCPICQIGYVNTTWKKGEGE